MFVLVEFVSSEVVLPDDMRVRFFLLHFDFFFFFFHMACYGGASCVITTL